MTTPTRTKGFTLVETLVAISLLTIAIVAPMALTSQSLATAYYARDQITAFYLAQEAIEAVRAIRDGQILQIARSPGGNVDLFGPIPLNTLFTIDTRTNAISTANCQSGTCVPLQTDNALYGYGICGDNSCNTHFTRSVIACYVQADGTCTGATSGEMRVSVTVRWTTGAIQTRSFTISSDLYRWVNDGSGN